MPNRLNSWIKAFFSLNKSEQRGIIVLIFIILLIAVVNLFLPYLIEPNSDSDLSKYKAEIEEFRSKQQLLTDSVNIKNLQNSGEINEAIALQKIKPFSFDPNKLPVEAWKKMGFTDQQISTIKKYEAKGGKFSKKEDLKKIYSISDIEYEIIEPYIHIPSNYKSKTGRVIQKKSVERKISCKNVNINSADSILLINSLGLTPWLTKRIISYRNILGGYINKKQLQEVYGLDEDVYKSIEKYIEIDTTLIIKIDINNVNFKDLLKHPYFDYNITKSTINTRTKIGSFSSVNQIKLIDGINDSTYSKVMYYLYIRPLEN